MDFWLAEVTHLGSRGLIHERSIVSIGFGKADFVRNVRVDSLVGSRLGRKRRIILLHHFFLHSDPSLFLVSLLIPDHFQILDLCLRSWR